MTIPEKQNRKLVDDFQTVAMMQSMKEMKDCKKKNSITSIIEHISAKKYIPQTKGAESIFEVLETFCQYMRLKHQYQLPEEIWMKIADWMQKDSDSYSELVGQDKRWIDFKQHWNTRLKILYQAVPSEELKDGTENIKGNRRQTKKERKRHNIAKKGDKSVRARSETYMDTKHHENFMMELQDGERKQMIEDVLNNILKITFTLSGDCRGEEKYFKQIKDKDFDKSDTYDGIQKLTNKKNKKTIKTVLKYLEDHKYTPMTNGAQYSYFKFMENVFKTLKQMDGYVMPIELRIQVAATQFCNCKNEGILMYAIDKNWVEKHLSEDDRMREQDWIDFKQHWNESLQDMYHENRWLKEKAEAGDKSVKEMADKYMNTEQHTINLSIKMKDGQKKRKLEGMVDKICKLKFCPKKGAERYFREFDALWEQSLTKCGYKVPEEICMQKARCAILIAKLPRNVTNLANLDWCNRMEKIKVENNTKDLADDVVVRDKMGDENKDETNPHFNSNGNKRNSPNKKKIKKAEEASKEENKSGNQQKGMTIRLRLYSNNKQALEILLEKMGKEKPIDGKIDLENETPEQTLEKISASHNMTVEELLVENNILKDDNPENLPEEKIQQPGIKKRNYKELSSNDDSNEKGEAEEDRMSDEEGDELPEERSTPREEEDKKNKEEADPIKVAMDPALQLGETENIEEKAAKATDPIENNEQEEKRQHGKDDADKNEEAAANDTDPIAVAADCTLQEDDTIEDKEREENKTSWKVYLPTLA
eukprot:jgi/Psemu1/52204/gm1.52204_g